MGFGGVCGFGRRKWKLKIDQMIAAKGMHEWQGVHMLSMCYESIGRCGEVLLKKRGMSHRFCKGKRAFATQGMSLKWL